MSRPQYENGYTVDRTRDIAIVYGPDYANYFVAKAKSICKAYAKDIETANAKNSGVTDADKEEWRDMVIERMLELTDQIDDVHDEALVYHFRGDPWNPMPRPDLIKSLEYVMKEEAGIQEKLA